MSPNPHKALVRRYYEEVLTQGRLGLLEELLAPDFRSYPPQGPAVDRTRYAELVQASLAAFPDLRVTVDDQLAEGDRVATRWTAHATHQGAFLGVPPSGRAVTLTGMHMHRVAGGRLVEHWEQLDLLGLLGQLGALPKGA
jgi:steroid delta-isomerase-like uncharacterized protein